MLQKGLYYLCYFIIIIFTQILFILTIKHETYYVKDCASEKQFDFSVYAGDNVTQANLDQIPKCFCDIAEVTNGSQEDQEAIKVACYFTSNLTDLGQALKKVQLAKKTAHTILISNMEFNEHGIPSGFFDQFEAYPQELTILTCNGNSKWLNLTDETFKGLERSLKKLKIYDCLLPKFPLALRSMEKLEYLTLNRVFVHTLDKEDFQNFHNLIHLELNSNQMFYIEPGSFDNLSKLETLILGPSNAFNETILTEINKLGSLKYLDMQSNSMKDLPDKALNFLGKLEFANFEANFIHRLRRHSFTGLKSLRDLNLALNMINYTEFSTFNDELENVINLNLWGNNLDFFESKLLFNLKSLKQLDLSYNNIPMISAASFKTNLKLEKVNLYKNTPLTIVEDQGFLGAESLKSLKLSANNMTKITGLTFDGLSKLEDLDLSETAITSIDYNAFKPLVSLQKLMLNNSKLTSINEELVKGRNFTLLNLSNNRWSCKPNDKWFIHWVQKNAINDSNAVKTGFISNTQLTQCWMPLESRGAPLTDLDPETLQPLHQPEWSGDMDDQDPGFVPNLGFGSGNNVNPSATLAPVNLFGNVTLYTFDYTNRDFDQLAGFRTLSPSNSGNNSLTDSDIKTIIICVVLAGVALTIAAVAIIIFIMKRRKKAKGLHNAAEMNTVNGSKDENKFSIVMKEMDPKLKHQQHTKPLNEKEDMTDVQL